MDALKDHWNTKYATTPTDKLGWYEEDSVTSLRLISENLSDKNGHVFIAGAGASLFIDQIIDLGYTNITACDISEVALNCIKGRLGAKASSVNWIVGDLTIASDFEKLTAVDYWHDRAVLHFFTDVNDRKAYFDLLKSKCNAGSIIMLAAFSKDENATKCSNLPVYKYDAKMFKEALGKDFIELGSFHEIYVMPSGDERDYVYGLYQRLATSD